MAFGSLIGFTIFSDTLSQKGPAGDIAGSAGALIVVICMTTGFALAMFSVIISKILHRGPMKHIIFRFVSSIVGGVIIGALGPNNGTMRTAATWLLLIILPVLLTWPLTTSVAEPHNK